MQEAIKKVLTPQEQLSTLNQQEGSRWLGGDVGEVFNRLLAGNMGGAGQMIGSIGNKYPISHKAGSTGGLNFSTPAAMRGDPQKAQLEWLRGAKPLNLKDLEEDDIAALEYYYKTGKEPEGYAIPSEYKNLLYKPGVIPNVSFYQRTDQGMSLADILSQMKQ